jgi:hypothetical protein
MMSLIIDALVKVTVVMIVTGALTILVTIWLYYCERNNYSLLVVLTPLIVVIYLLSVILVVIK